MWPNPDRHADIIWYKSRLRSQNTHLLNAVMATVCLYSAFAWVHISFASHSLHTSISRQEGRHKIGQPKGRETQDIADIFLFKIPRLWRCICRRVNRRWLIPWHLNRGLCSPVVTQLWHLDTPSVGTFFCDEYMQRGVSECSYTWQQCDYLLKRWPISGSFTCLWEIQSTNWGRLSQ